VSEVRVSKGFIRLCEIGFSLYILPLRKILYLSIRRDRSSVLPAKFWIQVPHSFSTEKAKDSKWGKVSINVFAPISVISLSMSKRSSKGSWDWEMRNADSSLHPHLNIRREERFRHSKNKRNVTLENLWEYFPEVIDSLWKS